MSENKSAEHNKLSVTFLWLAVAFCVCLVSSNLFVPRLWRVGSLPLQLSGAVIIFPISYIINDCLTEVYGFRKARLVIWIGFVLSAFIALAGHIITKLPAPLYDESVPVADSFNMLFGLVPRTTVSSLIAFICGSQFNAWVMSKMKIATKGRGFGWRAIVSSLGGELADSVIFYPLAFAGSLPVKGILGIILTQVTVKTLYEIIILPLTRLIVKKLKAHEGIDTYDYNISYNPFKIRDI
ncbi:MAG: queuosine precursor transporter [Bacteroidales bacterium]|nr:queuosine precursor transporter [Bacteroidales bacterium]MBO7585427.1 queuosine precursor transporter [Bacteroidales bacterium]MBP5317082.1 queuosine precursor transporter [Bacteroidales bacterium]